MVPEAALAIVGAGPAGLSAARQAAALGLTATLIDESPLAGGQYLRQSVPGLARTPEATPSRRQTVALLDGVRATGVRFLPRTAVWGIFEDRTLALHRLEGAPDAPDLLRAGAVILAAGAYERPFACPGWTLPGVFTAGGLQILAKSQGLLPGRRILLAGNGPFLLVVAAELLEAGAEVVAVVEASRPARSWAKLSGLLGHWEVVREGVDYLRRLARAGVPVLTGHAIVRVEGDGEAREGVIAPVTPEGRPDLTALRRFPVDAVGLGYGFVPSTELLRQAGGEVRHVDELGGWVPVRSARLESTVPGIFVAGDGAGIAGARVAMAEGRLAAIGAARALGAVPEARVAALAAPVLRELASLERLRAALRGLYRTPLGAIAGLTPDTLVCRCEAIAARQVDEAVRDGARSLHEVKIYTRAGMGLCQGRMCGPTVSAILAERLGVSPGSLPPPSARPPVKPIPLSALARLAPGSPP